MAKDNIIYNRQWDWRIWSQILRNKPMFVGSQVYLSLHTECGVKVHIRLEVTNAITIIEFRPTQGDQLSPDHITNITGLKYER